MERNSKLDFGRLATAASCLVIIFAVALAVSAQAPTFSITLTGQSMIRSDFRVNTPNAVATMSPLLKGDVIFTNFEAAVIEKEQSTKDGQ